MAHGIFVPEDNLSAQAGIGIDDNRRAQVDPHFPSVPRNDQDDPGLNLVPAGSAKLRQALGVRSVVHVDLHG